MMQNEIIQPLLLRPNPEVQESWRGYILRVSEDNVLDSPRTMLRYSKLSEDNLRTTFPHINNMVALTNKSVEILDTIYPVNHQNNSYKILGQPIPKAYVRVNTPLICSECVKELGYIPARWDVVYMNVCHKHKKHLIGHCPSCKSKLKWYRQGLLKCHCGYDFGDIVGSDASTEEVNFSELLAFAVERQSIILQFQNNPIPEPFFRMSLSTLLGVVNSIGLTKLGLNDDSYGYMSAGSPEAYKEMVRILSNWSYEFKELIQLNELKNGSNEISVRKRHENLYGSIFKKGYPENEISFVRDEFLRFAQSTDAPVYVDKRIKNKVITSTNLKVMVGINEAAKALGIMPSTLRKRIYKEEIQAQAFTTKQGKQRHLVNLDDVEKKIPNEMGELDLRKAAAYVGLPVRVIRLLRESNHYHDNHKTIYPKGWAVPDLDELISRFIAQGNQDCICSDLIPISKAMLMKFGSEDIKAEIIRGVLDGRIKATGLAQKIGEILVSKSEVMQLTGSKKLETADYLKFSDVSKLIGIDKSCLKFIHEKQIFRTKKVNYITYINREDVERFNDEYVALSRIAMEHALSPRKLLTQSELNGIHLFQIERLGGKLQSFIKQCDQERLMSLYFE